MRENGTSALLRVLWPVTVRGQDLSSVSASEFLVSLAASVGFILNLGSEGVRWAIAGALLAGGAVAAPFAAWLVRKVAPRVLGAGVGGLIVLTNVRTLLNQFDVLGSGRTLAYLLLGSLWVASCSMAVIRHRSEREEVPPQPVGV